MTFCGAVVVAAAIVAAAAISVGRTDAEAPASATRTAVPTLSSARSFLLQELQYKLDGNWGKAWSSLYPFHQRVAVKAVYLRCESATPFLARTLKFGILGVRRARVHVPGRSQTVPGAVVKLRVALAWYGPRDPIVLTPTFHLVAVAGRWRWLLSGQSYSMYRHEACGSPAA
jgi:hypothetical protein